MKQILPLLCLVFALAGCVSYDLKENQSYDPKNVPFGVFDAYYPKGPLFGLFPSDDKPKPVVIAIHGGAWQGGDKSGMHKVADDLCPLGYVVLSINYRLTSDGPWGSGAPWPAAIDDCQAAVRFFKANSLALHIDSERMASLGISAGGNLATMLALRPDPKTQAPAVRFACNLDGEHNMMLPPDQVMTDFDAIMTKAMGHPAPWSDAELKDISTVTFAATAVPKPKIFTVHGESDDNIFVRQAYELDKALKAAGIEHTMLILHGKDGFCHGNCWASEPANSAMHKFLNTNLKDK